MSKRGTVLSGTSSVLDHDGNGWYLLTESQVPPPCSPVPSAGLTGHSRRRPPLACPRGHSVWRIYRRQIPSLLPSTSREQTPAEGCDGIQKYPCFLHVGTVKAQYGWPASCRKYSQDESIVVRLKAPTEITFMLTILSYPEYNHLWFSGVFSVCLYRLSLFET